MAPSILNRGNPKMLGFRDLTIVRCDTRPPGPARNEADATRQELLTLPCGCG